MVAHAERRFVSSEDLCGRSWCFGFSTILFRVCYTAWMRRFEATDGGIRETTK